MANGTAPEYVMDETVDNANDMFESLREFLTFQVLSGLRYRRHPQQGAFPYQFDPEHTYLSSTSR